MYSVYENRIDITAVAFELVLIRTAPIVGFPVNANVNSSSCNSYFFELNAGRPAMEVYMVSRYYIFVSPLVENQRRHTVPPLFIFELLSNAIHTYAYFYYR